MSEAPFPVGPTVDDYLGGWGLEERGQASLNFVLEDFRVNGSDGCNRLMGSWELLEDGSVELKQLASTMMFCDDVDTWMTGASTVRVADGLLVVTDAEDTLLGALERRVAEAESAGEN